MTFGVGKITWNNTQNAKAVKKRIEKTNVLLYQNFV